MQSHLLANFSYCYTIEHETLAMYLLDLREQVMDLLERLTGARVTCAYMIPGGVRCDIHQEDQKFMHVSLDRIETELVRYTGMFETGPMIALRSRGIGILTQEAAYQAHAVGPTARASGIAVDQRTQHPTYMKLGFAPVVRHDCDNYARIMVRFDEIFQSIRLIRTCLSGLQKGIIRGGGTCTAGEIRYSGEAPRGELTYVIKTDEYGRVVEIQIQTPSIMNIEACCHSMIIGADSIADVTSTFVSADPCIACTER
jgi:energy-converting hydrogenase A subunit O